MAESYFLFNSFKMPINKGMQFIEKAENNFFFSQIITYLVLLF